ncbi:hypothetical protein I4F81_010371 [Pyropia yezoensis]|uniref:Uncharacterized protein n=1 Tax=Pyropia yezoensis TaxID=2788 RepID=A0ACC3CC72_PYRYE|nr:hypothetical protein I4F81_010371 [Neopyropia yezoensis]
MPRRTVGDKLLYSKGSLGAGSGQRGQGGPKRLVGASTSRQGGPKRLVGASTSRRKRPVHASTSRPKRPVDPSTSKELKQVGLPPHLVDACLACASFSALVGAVGPMRSTRAPVWTSTFATHPGRPNVIIDNGEVVRDVISHLKNVADPSPIKRTPLEAVLGGAEMATKGADKDQSSIDVRFPMVGLTASVGSGKTFVLERVATLIRRAFINRKGYEDEAAFARTRSPFGLPFNNHWTLHETDADIVTTYGFPIQVLTHLRIVFMHRADLVNKGVAKHFRLFVAAVCYMLRAKLLTCEGLERETVEVLSSGRCPDMSPAVPVLLVDEVGKADDSGNSSADRLIEHVRPAATKMVGCFITARRAVQEDKENLREWIKAINRAVKATAAGLSYCSGGHMRSAVQLAMVLERAAPNGVRWGRSKVTSSSKGAQDATATLQSILIATTSKLLLSEAKSLWLRLLPDDQDDFLTCLVLGERVDAGSTCFPKRDADAWGKPFSAVAWDKVRSAGLVVASGETLRPLVTPIMLFLLMRLATSSRFHKVLIAELKLEPKPSPAQVFTANNPIQWRLWEDFVVRHEIILSIARSRRPEEYKAISIHDLYVASVGAVHVGSSSLLHDVRVDASSARSAVHGYSNFLAILTAEIDEDRDNAVFQLLPGTPGADAIVFYKVVAAPDLELVGKWIMVVRQLKYSGANASTRLSPSDITKDWSQFPKASVMGKDVFDAWKGRMVYVNSANRKHADFSDLPEPESKATREMCWEQSIVLSRTQVESALGPTFANYLKAMEWIHCGTVCSY